MTDKFGLAGIWEDLSNYLKVDTDISQDETPDAKYPTVIRFLVTNTAQTQEDLPEIIFEEAHLNVGVPPDWHVETAKNLAGGQSFSYEHHCTYDAIMKLQWFIEGRVSPAALLQFRGRPNGIIRSSQLSIKAYFDFFNQMNIHQWLEGTLKTLDAPGPDTTLAEMKAKEDSLRNIIGEIRTSAQQLQDFLGLVNYKNYREDILKHRNLIQEYLNRTEREIADLIQILRTQRTDGFKKACDNTIAKLTNQGNELDKATTELAVRLGVIKADASIETAKKEQTPPPIALREIDLHTNHTVEEAIPMLGEFLKESYRDNVRLVRIIHGKGIGVLRNAIREYLETNEFVKSFGSADKDHGGEGATEANIKDFSVNA